MSDTVEVTYTVEQYNALTPEQKAIIDFLREDRGYEGEDLEEFLDSSSILSILRPSDDGCVPNDSIGENGLLGAIQEKFSLVMYAAQQLAVAIIDGPKPTEHLLLTLIIDPSYDGYTHMAVMDNPLLPAGPRCYFYDYVKAWHCEFVDLAAIADEVIRVRDLIVANYRRDQTLRALLSHIADIGTQDIYTDAPEYSGRANAMEVLAGQAGQWLAGALTEAEVASAVEYAHDDADDGEDRFRDRADDEEGTL